MIPVICAEGGEFERSELPVFHWLILLGLERPTVPPSHGESFLGRARNLIPADGRVPGVSSSNEKLLLRQRFPPFVAKVVISV
jgi:hypothetical protein